MRNVLRAVCWSGLLLLGPGCGEPGPRQVEVRGTVTWEDKPVEEGDIYFVPEDPALRTEAGKIKDGEYHLKVTLGKHKVRILACRLVPGKTDPMGSPLKEDYIPEKYNKKTILEAEVTREKTSFDFPLNPD